MKKPHYQWLCEEIEQALSESGEHRTPEQVAVYRARLRELIGRSQSHLQSYIRVLKTLETELRDQV